MNNICVFCGSNSGSAPIYTQAAQELGALLVERQIQLIYGGGNVGLMGIIANHMLSLGGKVVGVIPGFLDAKEVGHKELTKMIVVNTMHERKQVMADMANGFIAMPGGFGTLDELCEILTWSQLGLHACPIGLLNVAGYFDPLINMFDHMTTQRFLNPKNREIVLVDHNPAKLLQKMEEYEAPDVEKWLDRTRT